MFLFRRDQPFGVFIFIGYLYLITSSIVVLAVAVMRSDSELYIPFLIGAVFEIDLAFITVRHWNSSWVFRLVLITGAMVVPALLSISVVTLKGLGITGLVYLQALSVITFSRCLLRAARTEACIKSDSKEEMEEIEEILTQATVPRRLWPVVIAGITISGMLLTSLLAWLIFRLATNHDPFVMLADLIEKLSFIPWYEANFVFGLHPWGWTGRVRRVRQVIPGSGRLAPVFQS